MIRFTALLCTVLFSSQIMAQSWEQIVKSSDWDLVGLGLFGSAVDVQDDIAIIGAPNKDGVGFGSSSGAAYILELSEGVWTESAVLIPSDLEAGDQFGYSVALSNDRVVIGALSDDDVASAAGAVYVFEKLSGVWTEVAKLTASDATELHFLGITVDLDNDRIVAGSSGNDGGVGDNGAIYVFDLIAGTWEESSKLVGSDTEEFDRFSQSLSLNGNKIIAGAESEDDDGSNSGSAYIFEFIEEVWTETAKLNATDAEAGDFFGGAVSIYNDIAVVGARSGDNGELETGAAYVYELIGSEWVEISKLNGVDSEADDHFGSSVSLYGNRIAVSTNESFGPGMESGKVFIFDKIEGVWEETAVLSSLEESEEDGFGNFISLDDDRLAIGAFKDDGSLGAAYIFEYCSLEVEAFTIDEQICLGDSVILTGLGADSYVWDLEVTDGIAFTPISTGSFTYTVTGLEFESGCSAKDSLDLIVNALPAVIANSSSSEICIGDSLILSGTGADAYDWGDDIVDDEPFLPESIGTETYIVIGTDLETGCQAMDSTSIIVFALPEVSATANKTEICVNQNVILSGAGATTYDWDFDVVNDVPYTLETPGAFTFTVIGTDDAGCSNSASVEINSYENTLSSTATLSLETFGSDGAIDVNVSGGQTPYSYDWNTDETGDFDDEEDLFGLVAGTYLLTIKDNVGCELFEEFILGDQLNLPESLSTAIKVFPNPFTNSVFINYEEHFQFMLYGLDGSIIAQGASPMNHEIAVSFLESGVYILKIWTDNEMLEIRLTKL